MVWNWVLVLLGDASVVGWLLQSEASSVSVPEMSRARCRSFAGGALSVPVNAVPAGTGSEFGTPFPSRQVTKSTAALRLLRKTTAPSTPAFHEALKACGLVVPAYRW